MAAGPSRWSWTRVRRADRDGVGGPGRSRPIFHRLEDRIRAHVILCWLALLLIRVAETRTGDTWRNLRHELDRLHLGEFTGPVGTVAQRTDITAQQHAILRALDVDAPPASSTSVPPAADPRTTPAPRQVVMPPGESRCQADGLQELDRYLTD